jgi:hypothetical protein
MENLWHTRSNPVLDWCVDQSVWWLLQWYFAPYKMPSLMGDVDTMVSQVNLNGARWANLCKPGSLK